MRSSSDFESEDEMDQDPISETDFAVKIAWTKDSQIKEMNRQEFELMKPLDHPNIVKVQDYYQNLTSTHTVMERAQGTSLRQIFSEGHKLTSH